MADDDTIPNTIDTIDAIGAASDDDLQPGARYEMSRVLGRGGMGVVRLARDTRIDREVAIKLMTGGGGDPSRVARFFREARVQGALDHPAVVPVHDLGVDAAGRPFFVMKRLAGTTLAEVLAGPPKWTRPQLLAKLVDVCLAIELAHARGIVHRDLKPANIMLGDFGETYVLDWGLARIVDDTLPVAAVASPSAESTSASDLLGTPGYMAPEQARGEPVDARADVFALGLLLYEIVAGAPALPRGLAGLGAVLDAPHHRPSAVSPDAPPELDDLCARATAADPAARPSARELANGIQTYLDGDRDVARRAQLAAAHAERAEAARVRPGDGPRADAMREAGRALALDPNNALAQSVLGHLLLAAPRAIPAEALAAAEDERGRTLQQVALKASAIFVIVVAFGAVMLLLPLRHVWPVLVAMAIGVLGFVLLVRVSRAKQSTRTLWFPVMLALTCVLLTMAGLLLGPLFVMPILVTGSLTAFLVQPTAFHAWITIAAHAVPFAVLLALEASGAIATFHIERGALVLTPWILDLTPTSAGLILGLAIAMQFANSAITMVGTRRAQMQAQDRLHAQTWHLEQLLPRRAPPA